MTNAIQSGLSIRAQVGLCALVLVVMAMVLITMPATASASTDVKLEGTLQGGVT